MRNEKAKMRIMVIVVAACALLAGLTGSQACASTDWFASEVKSSSGLGISPYDFADAVLGKPTTFFRDMGVNGQVWACSVVVSSWNLDPYGNKIITTINPGGWITVEFATPIEDDPENWYNLDFIVFGNGGFNWTSEDYITPTTDMEECFIASGGAGRWEPSVVSVAQYENGPSYYFSAPTDPRADDFAPIQAFAWDYIHHTWGQELDFTKPVDPTLTKAGFGGKSAAEAIDMYKGSAGGTGFDISTLDLPTNSSGRKWIKYIKVSGARGEVDAFARVSHKTAPISAGAAKLMEDGVPVILGDHIVTAGNADLGDCCYVESRDRSSGIKLADRVLDRDKRVDVYGVMTTVNGERVLRVTAIDPLGYEEVAPVGLSCKAVGGGGFGLLPGSTAGQKGVNGGAGLNTIGLLVRIWGKVSLRNVTERTFCVNDGSGAVVKCAAPADTEFVIPSDGSFVSVTGVVSCEADGPENVTPFVRIRSQSDVR